MWEWTQTNDNANQVMVPAKKQKTEGEHTHAVRCDHCGRKHEMSQCQCISKACFECGDIGHMVRNCPQKQQAPPQPQLSAPPRPQLLALPGPQQRPQQQRLQAAGKIYAMTQSATKTVNNVVEAIHYSLPNKEVKVLFELGFIHLYINHIFHRLLAVVGPSTNREKMSHPFPLIFSEFGRSNFPKLGRM